MQIKELEVAFVRAQFRFAVAERRRLWLKLSKLLGNGVPILDALTSLQQRRVAMSGPKDVTAVALQAWINQTKGGQRFGKAIMGWVDTSEMMLISAGEQSGNLAESLQSTANVMDATKAIKSAVIGGLAYPVLMLLIALGVLVMFSFQIIPQFATIIPDDQWVGLSKVMVDFSNFAREWMAVIVGVPVALVVALSYAMPRWVGGYRIVADRYLPFSVYRVIHGSTWMISFAALVGSGMRIENALQQLSVGASPWMKARIDACLRGMRAGLNPGDALARSGYGFPDPEIIDDLGVYARLSGFDQALALLGKEWVTESVERIQGLMKAVFGVSILVVGLFIAFMVGGLIAMQLHMSDVMQGGLQ